MKIDCSVIIPAYNEEARLGATLEKVLAYLEQANFTAELIVVDDGSTDQTAKVARAVCQKFSAIETRVVRYEENRGKGYAVKTGLREARGEIALFSDADLSTPIEEMKKLVSAIKSGTCDVAFGSRALNRRLIWKKQPWRREQSGKVFNLMVRLFTGMPFWDTQCGFKAFRMNRFGSLLDCLKIDRFAFDVEFLYVAQYRGLRLKEIPVRWDHCEGSKISFWRDSRKMFGEIVQIRRNAERGDYDEMSGTSVLSAVEIGSWH